MNRREFLAAGAASATLGFAQEKKTPVEGELLYNGIRLPAVWPPPNVTLNREPLATPPYLSSPPEVIPIDVGRQLFVDDFLIDSNNLKRQFHRPEYHSANPLLVPDKPWEGKGGRARAGCFSDGVWFDPQDKLFKMWYWAAANSEKPLSYDTCLATSKDGIKWEKPSFDVVKDTNIVLRDEEMVNRNSCTVWLDLFDKDPERRFKMFRVVKRVNFNRIRVGFSPDGIHWKHAGESDDLGDRSTVFFNAFRNVWVYGIRTGTPEVSRCRAYAELTNPVPRGRWTGVHQGRGKAMWIGADKLDLDRADLNLRKGPERPADNIPSQLYNLDCIAYESVLLGLFAIWRGQPLDRPKINEICTGFSRDGFHWSRPDRKAFCPVSETKEAWNWGNVQSAGGCCLVVGDKLYFYVGGVSGRAAVWHPDPANVGLGILRRDGFASLDADEKEGTITTRPVTFTGKRLFVNVEAKAGELRAEVLDRDGKPIAPFTRDECVAVSTDSTKHAIAWKTTSDLTPLSGKTVRFRFHLKGGKLYSFWVSPDEKGQSRGYLAAGGPGYEGHRDE